MIGYAKIITKIRINYILHVEIQLFFDFQESIMQKSNLRRLHFCFWPHQIKVTRQHKLT